MIPYQDWNDQVIHIHRRLKLELSMHELGQNWLLIPMNHIASKFRQAECGVSLQHDGLRSRKINLRICAIERNQWLVDNF